MPKVSVPLILSILWFMAAWAIDHYALRPACEPCSDLFSLQLEFKFRDAAELTTKKVALIVLVAVPWIAYGLFVVPYRSLKSIDAWRIAFQRWCQPLAFFIGAFFLAFAVEYFIYDPVKEHLFEGLRSYIERFSVVISPIFPAIEVFKITSHLGGLLGLLFGFYLFLTRSWSVSGK